ncbi:PAS domain-containing sensor histidine kinase [Hydrogenimonas sp.]
MFQQYKEAIENSNIVSKTDINGIITFVNDEFCKISGYSKDELVGQNHNIIRHPDVPKESFRRLWDTILAKKTFRSTVMNMAKDGSTFYVNTTIIPILDQKGEIEEFIAIRYDVTKEMKLKIALEKKDRELEVLNRTLEERVRMQTRKLYELNKSLEERVAEEVRKNEEKQKMLFFQSRMANLGQMMANIAHQWRQPLTELSLTLFNIKKVAHQQDLKKVDAFYEESKQIMQNMSQTIEDFINFFKPGKPKEVFAPAQSVEDALQVFGKTLDKNQIDIKKRIDESLKIKGVRNELSQVLINLFQNANEAFEGASKESGRNIDISVAKGPNGCVRISVEDNAGGIPEDVLERLFEPYYTTKHAAKGTGLGLFMSKMIIEKSFAGTIKVDNTPEGAVFLIDLPMKGEE